MQEKQCIKERTCIKRGRFELSYPLPQHKKKGYIKIEFYIAMKLRVQD